MSGSRVLTLQGEVDVATVEALRADWYRLAEQEAPALIVVDLCEVTFIDAAALGLLVGVRNRQGKHGGTVQLRNPSDCVTAMLRLTGLLETFMCPHASSAQSEAQILDIRDGAPSGRRSTRQAI